MSSSLQNILETAFEERLQKLRSLSKYFEDIKEKLKSDETVRLRYTNKGILSKYYEDNGTDAPPLLLRQHNRGNGDDVDLLEAQSNLQLEYIKWINDLCTFTEEEIKYIIEFHLPSLSSTKDLTSYNIFCTVNGDSYILKSFGDSFEDKNNFFLTRFIIEDDIIPIFNTSNQKTSEPQTSVFLKV